MLVKFFSLGQFFFCASKKEKKIIFLSLVMRQFCYLINKNILYFIPFGFLEASKEDFLCPKPIRGTATWLGPV